MNVQLMNGMTNSKKAEAPQKPKQGVSPGEPQETH